MPDSSITIAAIPLDIAWADRDRNLRTVGELLDLIPADTDIVVLPELFSTGFIQDADVMNRIAEPTSGPTIATLQQYARSRNVAIAGSYLARIATNCYNRAFFIEPDGEETFYDKRHLFSPSSECRMLKPGTERPPVIRFRGWNISMIVCYDLRFPVWCRNTGNRYDIMLVPANWPNEREYAWRHLLIARAIENQAIVVGADCGGTDDYGSYHDMTCIFDAVGRPAGTTDSNTGIVYATFTRNHVDDLRRKFPVGDAADDFMIK